MHYPIGLFGNGTAGDKRHIMSLYEVRVGVTHSFAQQTPYAIADHCRSQLLAGYIPVSVVS
jgi:hypothetical protein